MNATDAPAPLRDCGSRDEVSTHPVDAVIEAARAINALPASADVMEFARAGIVLMDAVDALPPGLPSYGELAGAVAVCDDTENEPCDEIDTGACAAYWPNRFEWCPACQRNGERQARFVPAWDALQALAARLRAQEVEHG